MTTIWSIADLHFNSISTELFQVVSENWGYPGDIVIVVGDTDLPERLRKWPFHRTQNIVVPGNTDPHQNEVALKLYGGKLTVIGCIGANWVDTPWAHFHLHDQPCDPDPVLEWLEYEVDKATTEEIILATHYPFSYTTEEGDVFYPRFEELIKSDQRIKHVLHGHVHKGAGEIPGTCGQAKIHLVSADRLLYRPKKITTL